MGDHSVHLHTISASLECAVTNVYSISFSFIYEYKNIVVKPGTFGVSENMVSIRNNTTTNTPLESESSPYPGMTKLACKHLGLPHWNIREPIPNP